MDEIVEPNTPAVPSKLFEFSCAEYSFMVVLIDSSSSESPELLAMIQQMIYSASFACRLEFIPESNLSLAKFDVYHPRYPIYLILPSLRVIPRVSTALHLSVVYINDITRLIAIYNNTYKFVTNTYNIL